MCDTFLSNSKAFILKCFILQFLIDIKAGSGGDTCFERPVFVEPTPEQGATMEYKEGETVTLTIAVKQFDSATK